MPILPARTTHAVHFSLPNVTIIHCGPAPSPSSAWHLLGDFRRHVLPCPDEKLNRLSSIEGKCFSTDSSLQINIGVPCKFSIDYKSCLVLAARFDSFCESGLVFMQDGRLSALRTHATKWILTPLLRLAPADGHDIVVSMDMFFGTFLWWLDSVSQSLSN